MTHIKSAVSRVIRDNLWVIFVTALLSAVSIFIILLHWKNWAQFYGISLCVADGFVLFQSKRFFSLVFIPLYLFLVSFAVRNDFSQQYIFRQSKRRCVYGIQVVKIFFFTILYVFFAQTLVGVVSNLLFLDAVNWDLRNSLYYFITVQTAAHQIWHVILYSSLILAVLLQTMGLVLVLLRWVCDSFVYAWLVDVSLCIVYCRVKSDSLWNIYGVEHMLWTEKSTLYFNIVAASLLYIILSIIGFYIVSKKDFIQ